MKNSETLQNDISRRIKTILTLAGSKLDPGAVERHMVSDIGGYERLASLSSENFLLQLWTAADHVKLHGTK